MQSTWRAYHEAIAARHDRFMALPKQKREEAYHIVRARNGRGIVHIDEMLSALGMI